MFLVNSRTPFVIATCNLRNCRHPLYQRYGAILPNSLGLVILLRLGLFSQGHLSRFLVRTREILAENLFKDSRPQQKLAPVPGFNLFLTITVLQRLIPVKHSDKNALPSPKCQLSANRCRKRIHAVQEYEPVSLSCGSRLGAHLGPTNP